MHGRRIVLLIGVLSCAACLMGCSPSVSGPTLSVLVNPNAAGTVTNAPEGTSFTVGTVVTLTAAAASGYVFQGWTGGATGATNPATLTMDADKAVLASFASIAAGQHGLTILVYPPGTGTVARSSDGPAYAAGVTVDLTPTPISGYVFLGWGGDATGTTNPLTVTMDADKTVMATFGSTAENTRDLIALASPLGGGTVTLSAVGPHATGASVTLTATAASGYSFVQWTGDLGGSTNPTALVMDDDKTVYAQFRLKNGGGSVQGSSLSLSGAVTTLAGNPGNTLRPFFSGTGMGALLNSPNAGVIVGDYLYFTDTNNNRIRRMNLSTKAVTTFSGNGTAGCVDGETAALSQFNAPWGITTDGTSHLYVTDSGSHTIRAVSLSDGAVTTIAGQANTTGYANSTIGKSATFNSPHHMVLVSGAIYVTDYANHLIRKVALSGDCEVSTLAGNAGASAGGNDGTGTAATFNNPQGIATNGTNLLWVADAGGHIIREITFPGGVVTTVAGSYGVASTTDGDGPVARFSTPSGLFYDSNYLYITETGTDQIRRMGTSGYSVQTISGGTSGWADGAPGTAKFYDPAGMALSGSTLYFLDCSNDMIRSMNTGTLTTVSLAGAPDRAGYLDGTGSGAILRSPAGATTDGTYMYFTDAGFNSVFKMTIDTGAVALLAGSGEIQDSWNSIYGAGSTDGIGSAARFYGPRGITLVGKSLYVCDTGNHTIRRIDANPSSTTYGAVSTIAGIAGSTGQANGTGPAALFNTPYDITSDGINLYVTEQGAHTIRQIVIDTAVVSTLAGVSGVSGYDNGTGSEARFNAPRGITTDGAYLYVCDTENHVIRRVEIATATVDLLAGYKGVTGMADGVGSAARFNAPGGITSDGTNVYVSEASNHVIRKIAISSRTASFVAGTNGTAGWVDACGAAARFSTPVGLTTDGTRLLVCDDGNHAIRIIQ